MPELCNGVDDDCDGFIDDADGDLDPANIDPTDLVLIDELGLLSWYRDGDNDGYGLDTDTVLRCAPPVGYVGAGGDCNDAERETNPDGREEIGDDEDRNCDGLLGCYADVDGDGWGSGLEVSVPVANGCDAPGGGASSRTGDCDDSLTTVAPDAAEVCDSIDNDCDFLVDDADDDVQPDEADLTLLWLRDGDNDGYGTTNTTRYACTRPPGFRSYYDDPTAAAPVEAEVDCDDANFNIKPNVAEFPADGVDQNCNGQESCFEDADGDGYGTPVATAEMAGDPLCRDPGRSAREDDCEDGNAAIFPGAVEVCNAGVDDD